MEDLTGKTIGRYHVVEKLGQGGMATVYRAYDTRLERDVALKVVRTDMIMPSMLENMLKRFEREAKTLARMAQPNIVRVLDYGDDDGAPYLVMEYIPGGTLKIITGKPIPYRKAVSLVLPLARALEYAHNRGIVHRDVKPGNILITEGGEPMLTDFGIAKLLTMEGQTQLTHTGVGIGTPEYMAPEQWDGQVYPQTDIYALGVIFFELITGRRPYTADTPVAVLRKQISDPLPRPKSFVPDLPDRVEQVIFKALAKDFQSRFPDMSAFAEALEELGRLGETQKTGADLPDKATQPVTVQERLVGEAESVTVDDLVRKAEVSTGVIGAEKPVWWKRWPVWVGVISVVVITTAIINVLGRGAGNVVSEIPTSTPFPPSNTPVLLTSTVRMTETAEPSETPTPTVSRTPTIPQTPTSIYTPTLGIGSQMVWEKDDMTLVYVPEGEFLMGTESFPHDWGNGFSNEGPEHMVYLDAYWIDRTEVTNEMYAQFVADTGYRTSAESAYRSYVYVGNSGHTNRTEMYVEGATWMHPTGLESRIEGMEDYPVVNVSWFDAVEYCEWAGRRLPTEAEWEKAARGTDGRVYPWGGTVVTNPIPCKYANIAHCAVGPDAVGRYFFGESPYGARDMIGNVMEWVADWYSLTYYGIAPYENPTGPADGTHKVFRGGSWQGQHGTDFTTTMRYRNTPGTADNATGFRCAVSP